MPGNRKLHILMLEDNPADADLNAEHLTDTGLSFEYRRVETEQDFKRELIDFAPDIILADYRLPQFDSLAALRLARDRFPYIPYILVSGVLEEEAAIELFKAGVTDYIRKGRTARLGMAVKNALSLRTAQEEKARAEEELRRSYQDLERRIEERTRQLQQADAAQKESAQRFERLFNSNISGVVIVDFKGTILEANDYYLRLLGYSREEFNTYKIRWEEITPPEYLPLDFAAIDELKKKGFAAPYEKEYVTKNGARTWVYLSDIILPGDDPKIIAFIIDINERKKAEETLRRNEYELRTLVDNSPDLIFRLNRQMQYVYTNPAYERVTGIMKEQFAGKDNSELGMPQELVEFWDSTTRQVMESGQEQSVEFDMVSLFGKRYFFARLIPEFEKSGLVETVLVIARDITERKHAEEQIRYISFHDEVTELFNRAFYEEEIRRSDTGRDIPLSIIMGDVNNLKLTNDVFGHDEGDKLLKTIAGCITKACRSTDVVARWGGDEFAVILPKTEFATAQEVLGRIIQLTGEAQGTVLRPSIAVGAATKDQPRQNIYQTIRLAEQRMYDHKLAQAQENRKYVISTLLGYVREHTQDYKDHLERSYALARRFSTFLKLSEEQMDDLCLIIELHDIGNAVIPAGILTKQGRLDNDERSLMKKHAEAGFKITKTYAETARISDEVYAHSEHWDGNGYPRGLKGKEIPYLSRVFMLIDAYDVMTHPRHYAPPLTEHEAVEELRRNAGIQFDPDLTEAFINMLSVELKETTSV